MHSNAKIWTIPCKEEIRIAFKIGGKVIDVNPQDVSVEPEQLGLTIITNKIASEPLCVGTVSDHSFPSSFFPFLFTSSRFISFNLCRLTLAPIFHMT